MTNGSDNELTDTGEAPAARHTVRTGYLSGPGFTDVPVRYIVMNGLAIFNGCIEMGPAEEVAAHAAAVRARLATGAATPAAPGAAPVVITGIGLPSDSDFLWTGGVVPFVVDDELPDPDRVTQAIAHLHDNTAIRFVARTNQRNYVRFVRNPGSDVSWSAIGMRGGEQFIRLSDGATMGTVVHECCHALGILHEQSRCDRDQFVQINYENIQDDFESQFDKFCAGYDDYFDYDYGSIMHYRATAFSKNGQPTITPLQSGVTIGQRAGLSFGDRITIADMYARFFGRGHTGVWRSGSGRYGLWVNASWDSFRAKWQEWAAEGLRLVDINVRRVGNEIRYSGVWLPGTGGYGLWANASWDSFRAKWQEWAGQGLRLVDMHVLRVGNEIRYSGVWLPGTGGYGLWVNASWDSFRAKWQEWAAEGLRLVDINVHQVGGEIRYSGVWLPGTGGYGLWANASWDSFRAKWQEWAGQGLRLVDINVHQAAGENRYSGVFLPGTDGYYLWANVPWESLRARWQQLGAQGLRLVDYEFTEPATADTASLDFAGVPLIASTAESIPVGAGGIVDGTTSSEPAGIPANGRQAAVAVSGTADGQGGYHGGDTVERAATVADGDGAGQGGAHPGKAAASSAAVEDGMGEAVANGSHPVSSLTTAEVTDGLGAAVS